MIDPSTKPTRVFIVLKAKINFLNWVKLQKISSPKLKWLYNLPTSYLKSSAHLLYMLSSVFKAKHLIHTNWTNLDQTWHMHDHLGKALSYLLNLGAGPNNHPQWPKSLSGGGLASKVIGPIELLLYMCTVLFDIYVIVMV